MGTDPLRRCSGAVFSRASLYFFPRSFLSLPGFLAACLMALFGAWLVVKLVLDPEPYLFNGGKLGSIEKQSVFVQRAALKKRE